MKRCLFMLLVVSLGISSSYAQLSDTEAMKNANNPLASFKAVSVHNVYTPSLHAVDGTMNTTWLRYAQPIKRVLVRASLPINTVNVLETDRSGLGDLNAFATYIVTPGSAKNQVGVGPILTIPTATSSALGSGKWQIGAAVVAYFGGSNLFQGGLLATWQHSFAGCSNRNSVHVASIQPFFIWQLGNGVYVRNTAITILDFANKNHLIPIGIGIGKVIPIHKVVCNIFVEPQFSVWHKGAATPKTQVFIGFNTQF